MTGRTQGPNEQSSTIQEERITIPAEVGDVHVRIVKPAGAMCLLPVVLYVHGEARIHDDEADTREVLARDFALGARTAVVFIGHTRSPAADRPVETAQAYAAVRWVTTHGAAHGLDASRMVLAGDRRPPNVEGREIFADGPHLSGRAMAWFWTHYSPDLGRDEKPQRGRFLSQPLSARSSVSGGLRFPASVS